MTKHSEQRQTDPVQSTKKIDGRDDFEKLISTEERVLVDFYADWCGPCRMMAPIVEELAKEEGGTVVKVDVETLPGLASEYDVSSIPTFLLFVDGSLEDRMIGMQNKETLSAALTAQ